MAEDQIESILNEVDGIFQRDLGLRLELVTAHLWESEPDPYAGVPMLWQLPSEIRSKLPKLSISVHVYSPEAAGRFVIVDRGKYREGDVLTGGAKLEAIVADGIVLDYQGRRYRIGN